ncbi:unnamed protein product [Ilex paraguariensis]|uniref:BHLH domain-containing protein n=1 Tax=Ilex paraguariensis TaxID=185542 RepID=A0ABC8QYK6_9AQUA
MTMGIEDNGDMGFELRGGASILDCPSSGVNSIPLSEKIAGRAMSSGAIFKSTNGADPFFGSDWNSLSLNQSGNFEGSSMVPHNEFANPAFPIVVENQAIGSSSHFVHYPSDLGLVEMVPKLPGFGSGSFSEMVSSFGLPENDHITNSGRPLNYLRNKEGGIEKTSTNNARYQECKDSEEGAPLNGRKKRRASESHSPFNTYKNAEGEQQKDPSVDSSEFLKKREEREQKIEQNISANLLGKQTGKQAKDNSKSEAPRENYIHVRAKRGHATNSHSLAERLRREKISERMRLLQELVPGCNKITGKAIMLDEIINYVQSLQQQVEFLSMKLATVNPDMNVDIEQILSKDIHSRGSNAGIFGLGQALSSSYPFPQGIPHGTLPCIPSTAPPFNPMSQVTSRSHHCTLILSHIESINSGMLSDK